MAEKDPAPNRRRRRWHRRHRVRPRAARADGRSRRDQPSSRRTRTWSCALPLVAAPLGLLARQATRWRTSRPTSDSRTSRPPCRRSTPSAGVSLSAAATRSPMTRSSWRSVRGRFRSSTMRSISATPKAPAVSRRSTRRSAGRRGAHASRSWCLSRAGWTLPLYEAALLTANGPVRCRCPYTRPRTRPLEHFGPAASAAVAEALLAAGSASTGAGVPSIRSRPTSSSRSRSCADRRWTGFRPRVFTA